MQLLACALGCYSEPWVPPDTTDDDSPSLGTLATEDGDAAETYYLAAKKRMGLLGTSLLDVQCFYLACVYESHAFRPLQAWFHVQQASARLRVYASKMRWGSNASQSEPSVNGLEQRVYWSLFKAERWAIFSYKRQSIGSYCLALIRPA